VTIVRAFVFPNNQMLRKPACNECVTFVYLLFLAHDVNNFSELLILLLCTRILL
jgi:hypothetical protein